MYLKQNERHRYNSVVQQLLCMRKALCLISGNEKKKLKQNENVLNEIVLCLV